MGRSTVRGKKAGRRTSETVLMGGVPQEPVPRRGGVPSTHARSASTNPRGCGRGLQRVAEGHLCSQPSPRRGVLSPPPLRLHLSPWAYKNSPATPTSTFSQAVCVTQAVIGASASSSRRRDPPRRAAAASAAARRSICRIAASCVGACLPLTCPPVPQKPSYAPAPAARPRPPSGPFGRGGRQQTPSRVGGLIDKLEGLPPVAVASRRQVAAVHVRCHVHHTQQAPISHS